MATWSHLLNLLVDVQVRPHELYRTNEATSVDSSLMEARNDFMID